MLSSAITRVPATQPWPALARMLVAIGACGKLKIGIGEDELRAFAAEFQRHRFDAGAGDIGP